MSYNLLNNFHYAIHNFLFSLAMLKGIGSCVPFPVPSSNCTASGLFRSAEAARGAREIVEIQFQ